MKTIEVFIKMAFLLLKNLNFPQNSAKWQQKFKFSEIFLKFHPTKRESEKNHITFIPWAVTKDPKISRFVVTLAHQKIKQLSYFSSLLAANCSENLNSVPSLWGTSKVFEKIEKLTKSCHSETVKKQLCFRGNQRCSILNQPCSRKKSAPETPLCFSDDSELWNFSFSVLFRAESAMFRDFQVMNSAETDLKLFWIRADQRWMSLRCQLEKASEGSVFCCKTLKYIELALTSSMEGVKATLFAGRLYQFCN